MKKQKTIIISIIIILPILCFITKLISFPKKDLKYKYLNNKEFLGKKHFIKSKSKFNGCSKIRINCEIERNDIKFYFVLFDENIKKEIYFDILIKKKILDNFEFDKIYSNYKLSYIYSNDSLNITFKEYDKSIFPVKKYTLLLNEFIFIIYNDSSEFMCYLNFTDFSGYFSLKKTIFNYYTKNFIKYVIYHIILFFCHLVIIINHYLNGINIQNISIFFLIIYELRLFKDILYNFFSLFYFVKFKLIFKILIFYFHLLVYSEIIFNVNEILSIIYILIHILLFSCHVTILEKIHKIYLICFYNKYINGVIHCKISEYQIYKLFKKFFIKIEIFCIVTLYIDYKIINSVYLKFLPLIVGIIVSIFEHLSKREIMDIKTKKNCMIVYLIIIISWCIILIYYCILFKSQCLIFPFLIILILTIILNIIIKFNIKIKYFLRNNYEILENLNKKKEKCSICIQSFSYNHNLKKKFFCFPNAYDIIHKTKCEHFYHEICLYEWIKYKNICPFCRKKLNEPKYYYFWHFQKIKF